MGYIGRGPVKSGAFRIIDDIASSFNGSTTGFTLQHNSSNLTPGTEQNLLIAVDGVLQEPVDAFTISSSTITFTSAPASGASFWGVELGDVGGVASTVANGTVGTTGLAADAVDGTKIADNAINSEHYTDASIDTAHIANDQIDSQHYAAGSIDLEHMSSQSVDEDNLHISNAGSNGEFLSKSSNAGGLTWAAAGGDLSFGGDTFTEDKVIGSNDAYSLSFETAGVVRMKIHGPVTNPTSAGSITMPTQPCVSAINTSTDASQTGDGESPTVDYNSVLFDQGGDFANDIFTAPVTGRYLIMAEVSLFNLSTSHDAAALRLVETDKTWYLDWGNVGDYKDANGVIHYGATAIVDMDVGNTMRIQVRVNFGASNVGIVGNAAPTTWFSAMLVA